MSKGSRNKPEEQVAVKTTIVGGRPPGSGRGHGDIPRGIEVLVKKASVDSTFRQELMEKRAGAARSIDLELTKPEIMMLNAAPEDQLAAVIDSTKVPERHHTVFLGTAAALMLAAIGVTVVGCNEIPATTGSAPDPPPEPGAAASTRPETIPATDGIRPDVVEAPEDSEEPPPSEPVTRGIRPDYPRTKGIQPDRPEAKDE
jgi:hypothetical protein